MTFKVFLHHKPNGKEEEFYMFKSKRKTIFPNKIERNWDTLSMHITRYKITEGVW